MVTGGLRLHLFLFATKAEQLLQAMAFFLLGGAGHLGAGGAALSHGRQHRILSLGKGIVEAIGPGYHDGDTDFRLQAGGQTLQVHFNDFCGAGANPDDDGGVAIALDIFTESLQLLVII